MPLSIETRFGFTVDQPTDILLQFEAAAAPGQEVLRHSTEVRPGTDCSRVPAQDEIGERIWLSANGPVEIVHAASVEVSRQSCDLSQLRAPDAQDMPSASIPYLFDTRYCFAEKFQPFVEAEFEGTQGGARIAAIREWISQKLTYAPGTSNADTTALDTFVQRSGVCRDFAHVLVSFARASAIPARYVACYAPEVEPPDFHAVAEVFLCGSEGSEGGAWHLIDATGMSRPEDTVIIGVGRDAADVSFLTTFGPSQFDYSEVKVTRDE